MRRIASTKDARTATSADRHIHPLPHPSWRAPRPAGPGLSVEEFWRRLDL